MCVGGNTYRCNHRDIRISKSQELHLAVELDGVMATEKPLIGLPSSPGMSHQPTVPRVPIPESEVPVTYQ